MEAYAAVPVPAGLSAGVRGYRWSRDLVGASGGAVYRLHGKPGRPDLFLKHGRDGIADDVTGEMVRLVWLADRIAVPKVERFVRERDEAWLLMTALPGQTAHQALAAEPASRPALVEAMAAFLRRLHAIPVSECPFTGDQSGRLACARARIDAGLVDVEDFDDERRGWTAEQVWEATYDLRPATADLVVTHGDFTLDNLLIDGGEVVGCIDVGRVGIADRYQDLALLWRDLGAFGPSLQSRLLERYGIDNPDRRRLTFHLMLDELF